MKQIAGILLCFCGSAAALAIFAWPQSSQIKLYTADELLGVTCEELGARHEEVIFAYHDAEIAYFDRAGVFHEDLGLPKEDDLPFVVLMRRFMEDNAIKEADIAAPRSPSAPVQRSRFYAETSAICAATPSMSAVQAMRQAAKQLNLID